MNVIILNDYDAMYRHSIVLVKKDGSVCEIEDRELLTDGYFDLLRIRKKFHEFEPLRVLYFIDGMEFENYLWESDE